LPRYTPVFWFTKPRKIGVLPLFWIKNSIVFFNCFNSNTRHLFNIYKPLLGNKWFNNGAGSFTVTNLMNVLFYFFELPNFFKLFNDKFSSFWWHHPFKFKTNFI